MNNLLLGFFAPWLLLAGILVLHLVLPARTVEGYALQNRGAAPLRYRLNGLLVFVAAVIAWFAAGYSGAMPWDWLWRHRWPGAAGACALGLLVSVALMLTTPGRGRPVLAEFFLGRRDNPRLFGERVDAKMFLYIYGATLLQLNLLSFAAHHFLSHPGNPSPGVILYLALFAWFLCDYLVFERVHLYTYDLVAERLGFKLVWGCLAWYPYFYGVAPRQLPG